MKNIIIFLLIIHSTVSFACDNCNIFLNISPNDYRNSFGFYYHTRYLSGTYNELGQMTLKHGGIETSELLNKKVEDLYSTYELRGTFYLREKWKTLITLPVVDNTQKIDGLAKFRIKGIADPIIVQTYQVYNTKESADSTEKVIHRFALGGGLKVPLGSIDKTYAYGKPNLDLQPGSGSWDFLFVSTYSLRYKSFGVSSNLNVKFNSYNKDNYRYGNTLNFSGNVFYIQPIKDVVFMPFTGAYVERFEKDYEHSIINDSGGATIFGNLGLKVYKGSWSLNAQYQKVLSTNLNGETQLFTINRTTVGLNYNF